MYSSRTILVVDDDPNLRETLALILQQAGYRVAVADSAEAALKCLKQGNYALAFLDVKMPGRDGLSLLPEIRQLYPGLPVLILSAYVPTDSERRIWEKNASGYLTKPVEPTAILAQIATLCPLCAQS